jgi:hypothetical protein
MKARTWIGWVITGLMAALMLLSAVPDVLRFPGALTVFRHLGYPPYLLLLLGTAKILGVAAVLTPGVPWLKEWAFAGLTFDLTGALYSHLSVGDPASVWMPAAIGLMLMAGSYIAYWTRLSRDDASPGRRVCTEGTAAGHQVG